MELRQGVKLKIPFGRRRGLIKFLVALESMRAVVSMVCLISCREIRR